MPHWLSPGGFYNTLPGGEGRGEGRTPAGLPEILDQAQHADLPGLDRQRVIDLKMDGTRDEELYRDLLLVQCHALHQAMPFLFEPVDDETELLLPDNLLQTDSLIRELVTACCRSPLGQRKGVTRKVAVHAMRRARHPVRARFGRD